MARPLSISRPAEQQALLANTLARLALGRVAQPARHREPFRPCTYYIGLTIWLVAALALAATVASGGPPMPAAGLAIWVAGLLALVGAALHDSQ
jgi:hypothetical protein